MERKKFHATAKKTTPSKRSELTKSITSTKAGKSKKRSEKTPNERGKEGEVERPIKKGGASFGNHMEGRVARVNRFEGEEENKLCRKESTFKEREPG